MSTVTNFTFPLHDLSFSTTILVHQCAKKSIFHISFCETPPTYYSYPASPASCRSNFVMVLVCLASSFVPLLRHCLLHPLTCLLASSASCESLCFRGSLFNGPQFRTFASESDILTSSLVVFIFVMLCFRNSEAFLTSISLELEPRN